MKVIIRSRDSGVIYGKIIERKGKEVLLDNTRQLWRWYAAKGITLIDVAKYGVVAKECKFSEPDGGPVIVLDACSIIACTPDAERSIENA